MFNTKMFNKTINNPQDNADKTETAIELKAGEKTDFFVDPASDFKIMNAPIYGFEPEDEFTFSCKVTPAFKNTYDAGAIMLYSDDFHWIKFAFENTDLGYTSVVTVVTDGVSDDSNGERIDRSSVWLKISQKSTAKGKMLGFYYSSDGKSWKMVRLFRYEPDRKTLLGLEAQSPLGDGCKVVFEEIDYSTQSVTDLRKGE